MKKVFEEPRFDMIIFSIYDVIATEDLSSGEVEGPDIELTGLDG